jgi:hypothetical protein
LFDIKQYPKQSEATAFGYVTSPFNAIGLLPVPVLAPFAY